MKRFVLTTVIIFSVFAGIIAQIRNVPADFPTIQAAIDAAHRRDTVLVEEGIYYENINYSGKAITVASRFILDGDISHISKTIIDGSRFNHPDLASVVSMVSGEDTTSVLMGFTITGGYGTVVLESTLYERGDEETHIFLGAGIFILNAGGKICHNIIEENLLWYGGPNSGGGLCAIIPDNRSVIIRNNSIINNKGDSGAGIYVQGEKIIIERNRILNNQFNDDGYGLGGGVRCINTPSQNTEGVDVAVIRNNIISGNISHNGGGIHVSGSKIAIYNNTLWNNQAIDRGHELCVDYGAQVILFNNIAWSDNNNGIKDLDVNQNFNFEYSTFFAYNNILKEIPELSACRWFNCVTIGEAKDNLLTKPSFEPDSQFKPDENCISNGRGIDSLFIHGEWYYAPNVDIYGNPRSNPVDTHVDIGAVESPYGGTVGIPGSASLNAVTIFPNPTNSFLTIETDLPGYYSIEIISTDGKLVHKQDLEGTTIQLDISYLQKGTYLITIMFEDFVTTRKLIKL